MQALKSAQLFFFLICVDIILNYFGRHNNVKEFNMFLELVDYALRAILSLSKGHHTIFVLG